MLWEQSSRLVARGHDVRVVCRAQPASDASVTERQGVRIRGFAVDRRTARGFMLSSMLGARRAVALELEKDRADVVHVHQPLAGYGVLTSPAVRGLPRLYSFHSPAPLEYRSRRGMTAHHRDGVAGRLGFAALWGLERACLRRATAIQVLSDYSSELLWKLYRISREKVVKIPGAVDTASFRPAEDRAAVRKALDLPAERSLLLTVRNLEGRMGLDLLIRTMAILTQNMPEALLLIGGAGTLRRELESLSNALGLRERVRFLGFIPDAALPLYYQAADVFVLPTRELEGFGLVTVEALACGTPVLGTPVGATPEILVPLSPALVFRGLAPETMAEDLRRFLEAERRDPEAHARLRAACRRHAEAHYAWDRTIDALEDELSRLAARPAAPPGPPVLCPACEGETRPSSLLYRGAPYRQCPRCRSSVVAAPPTVLELQHYYQTEYPRRFSPACVDAERSDLFVSVLDRLDRLGVRPTPDWLLLDVGCGGGHLLGAARGRGWRAVGTDLSWQACAITHEEVGRRGPGRRRPAPLSRRLARCGHARQRRGSGRGAEGDPWRGLPHPGAGRAARAPRPERQLPSSVGEDAQHSRPIRALAGVGRLSDHPPLRVHRAWTPRARRARGIHGARAEKLGAHRGRSAFVAARARRRGRRLRRACVAQPLVGGSVDRAVRAQGAAVSPRVLHALPRRTPL